MVTEDLMFAVEDNRDDEDMRAYYSEHGMIGTYKGIDISEIAIDGIENMRVFNNDEVILTLDNCKWADEIWQGH